MYLILLCELLAVWKQFFFREFTSDNREKRSTAHHTIFHNFYTLSERAKLRNRTMMWRDKEWNARCMIDVDRSPTSRFPHSSTRPSKYTTLLALPRKSDSFFSACEFQSALRFERKRARVLLLYWRCERGINTLAPRVKNIWRNKFQFILRARGENIFNLVKITHKR